MPPFPLALTIALVSFVCFHSGFFPPALLFKLTCRIAVVNSYSTLLLSSIKAFLAFKSASAAFFCAAVSAF
jgi:hypothetical protein